MSTDEHFLPAIDIPGITNLRDVGGQTTADGRRVRAGLLYRSGQLDHADEHMTMLQDLDLGVVYDLRTQGEATHLPDRLPPDVELVHLDVLAGAESSLAAHLEDLFTDPIAAEAVLRSGDIPAHYLSTYRGLVSLESARDSYRSLYTDLVERSDVALFHCTAGKDRTGWAAAALLTLLGVPYDDVLADYLRSSRPVVESFRPVIDQFAAAGGDPELLEPVFMVDRSYLDAAMDEVRLTFGSIEGYFGDGLGLDADVLEALPRALPRLTYRTWLAQGRGARCSLHAPPSQ